MRSAAGSTVLSALLPTWGQEGGASATVGRLRTAGDRRRIAQDMERGLPAWENWFGMVGPPERIVVANAAPPNEDAAGRTLAELAAERGVEPAELVFDLLTRSIREGIVPVEEAVARLTARAAERLGLGDRGRIPPGLRADLVLVDREALCGTATYEEPRQYPDGVVAVWVAGRAVWQDGRATSERPGGVVQEARR
jgi:N-acyl-D-aspartate/D-glutamate deacylase